MPSFERRPSPYSDTPPYPTFSMFDETPEPDMEKRPSKVNFALPATIILNNNELWTLYHFETHAISCASCHNPYYVHRSKRQLCRTGQHLAQGAVKVLFNQVDTVNKQGQLTMVEVPASYLQTSCLLYTSPSPRDGLLSRMPSSA